MSIKSINDNDDSPNLKLFGELTNNSYSSFDLDNTFAAFKTVNDFLFLVYSTKSNSLICYDLINFIIIIEIKHPHKINITNIRHFLDLQNNRDLIISISDRDNNLKLWNVNNWECILDIPPAFYGRIERRGTVVVTRGRRSAGQERDAGIIGIIIL